MPHWFLLICFGILGAIWGSFVAAMCSRWPNGESVTSGRSHCDSCGKTVVAYDLIPIASYLFLHGKCRACGQAIGAEAIWIEIVATMVGIAPLLLLPPEQALALALFGWLLLPLVILDHRHLWLPNSLVLLLAIGGVLFGLLLTPDVSAYDRVLGAVCGYLTLQSVRLVFFAVRKIEGMGAGDPKLLAALGIWLGWQALPMILLLATFFGLIWALYQIGIRRSKVQEVAFGTMLASGALVWTIGQTMPSI